MFIDEVVQAAAAQGWRADTTKRGHPRIYPTDTRFPPIVGSGTPSDWRSARNFLAEAKRAGLQWPWPPPRGESRRS